MTINNVIKIAIFLLYGLFTVVAGFTAQLDTPEQTHIRIIEGSIIIENRHYLCEISSVKGLQWSKMFNKAAESDYLLSDDTSSLFQIFVKRICLYSTDFTVTEIKLSEQGNDKSVKVFLTCASKSIDAVLTITSDNSPQILFSLSIKNQSNDTIKLQPIFPVLARVAIDKNLENTHYFYPWRSGIVGSIDCEHTEEYGNCAWMQVISLFNPFSGTGLYVYPKDKTGGFKGLMLKKSSPTSETVIRQAEIVLLLEMPKRGVFDFEEGTGLAYYYPEREIQPGREYILPETVISIYRGDWKEALRDYSAWAHTWYKHVDTPQWFKNCFNYIIGQPHIFYSEKEKKYITSENLKGSEHILQWSFWDDYEERPNLNYSQFARYRPGDFNYHQKRGGLKVFKEEIKKIQEKDIRFTVYINHRFCWKETNIGKAYGEKWAAMYEPGKYGYHGAEGDQWLACFYEPSAWAEYIANTCGRIIEETGMDGIYLDELPLTYPCYNPGHTHYQKDKFPVSYELMTQHIIDARNAIVNKKSEAVLMTEHAGSDYFSQFFDGSWSQTFWQEGFPFAEKYYDGNSLNYFRFCFPEFKLAEYGESSDQVRRCFFNGIGRMGGLGKAGQVLKENGDAFASLNPEPLIETKIKQILANKFPTSTKIVYTVYNKSNKPTIGEMLEVEPKMGYHYIELLNDNQIVPKQSGKKDSLSFEINANEVVCIGQFPELINLEQVENRLSISLKQPLANTMLIVFSDIDTSDTGTGEGKKIELRDGKVELDVVQTFGHKGKVILKLLQGETLVDEVVAEIR